MGSVAAGKAGIRDFLKVTPGLRAADGVKVASADVPPEEMTTAMVLLGSVTIVYEQAGLQGRAETPTVSCWVISVQPGNGEDAVDLARDAAEALFSLVEAALAADPSAAGAVPPPGRAVITAGGLTESPVSWDGSAARRADRAFSLTWTSHTT
jgi:hypothetical protein